MKKLMAFVLAGVCVLGLVACSDHSIDTQKPVFETENIQSITLFCVPNHTDGIEVPGEYMEEMTAWIGTFTLDKEAGERLDPGTNTISFRLEYSDGTIVESGVNTTTIDGVTYYMKQERAPEFFHILFSDDRPAE